MTDLISRQQTVEKLEGLCKELCRFDKKVMPATCYLCRLGIAIDAVKQAPAAERKEKKMSNSNTHNTLQDVGSVED